MLLLIIIVLFFTVAGSGLSVFLFKSENRRNIKLLLAFSGAYLLAITFLHLIPEIYHNQENAHNIGIFILAGFFLQVILELFSQGLEHGHTHHHHHGHLEKDAFPTAIFISLCIHSFLEAMPLTFSFDSHTGHSHLGTSLLLGIVLHKIPISIVLMTLLVQSGLPKAKSVYILLLFAFMAPLGAMVSLLIGENIAQDITVYFDFILAIVVGIFLHISTTILFESGENHRFNIYKFITIVLGAIVAILSS
jgi:zinc and cadmium transporter